MQLVCLWVHSITKSRFERTEDERQGVQVLIDLLTEHLKLKIEYDARGVVCVTPPSESPIMGLFGRTAKDFDDLAEHWGCSHEEACGIAVKALHELSESGPRARKVLTEMFYVLDELGQPAAGAGAQAVFASSVFIRSRIM
jgi:hypothetical protein